MIEEAAEHPLSPASVTRIPRALVLTSRSGGLMHYVRDAWTLATLEELPQRVKVAMTDAELKLCSLGYGPYLQGADWARYLVLTLLSGTMVDLHDADRLETQRLADAEDPMFVWRLYNEKRDVLGFRYVELQGAARTEPCHPWEMGESEWTLKVGRTVEIEGERWQARHSRSVLRERRVWVQCFGPYEDRESAELQLEHTRRVLRRLDASPERLYLFGATPDDAHREALDAGAWALEEHASNGMPAYAQVGGRRTLTWRCGYYVVQHAGGAPILRVACAEGAAVHHCDLDGGAAPPRGGGSAWECTGHVTRDGEVKDWVRVPELRCGADDEGHAEHARHVRQRADLDQKDRKSRDLRPRGAVKCEKRKLQRGDHIFVPTERGGVYHHAIALDDPEPRTLSFRLVHYLTTGVTVSSSSEDSRFVARDWVWLLPRGNYYEGKFGAVRRSADEIVREAVRVYQSAHAADRAGGRRRCAHGFATADYCGYHLNGGNNCEHFCTYVVVGKKFCHQATETNKDIGATLGGGVLAGALPGAFFLASGPIGWTAGVVTGLAGLAVAGWHAYRLPGRAMDASEASRQADDQHASDAVPLAAARAAAAGDGIEVWWRSATMDPWRMGTTDR